MTQPYHKYVFDEHSFVGQFEAMYRAELYEGFDSWQQDNPHNWQEDILRHLLPSSPDSILDLGCGKGRFTSTLNAQYIMGVDISETAIKLASSRYSKANFIAADIRSMDTLYSILSQRSKWNLIILKEILSYLHNWKEVLLATLSCSDYVLVSLYLPSNPKGFVKSHQELRSLTASYPNNEVLVNNNTLFLAVHPLG